MNSKVHNLYTGVKVIIINTGIINICIKSVRLTIHNTSNYNQTCLYILFDKTK